jgi:hypothetical protein
MIAFIATQAEEKTEVDIIVGFTPTQMPDDGIALLTLTVSGNGAPRPARHYEFYNFCVVVY